MSIRDRFTFVETKYGCTIRLLAPDFPEPRLVQDGTISFTGWPNESDARLYLSLWTDDELQQAIDLTYHLWSLPADMGRKPTSNRLERLKGAVQKRGGKRLANS